MRLDGALPGYQPGPVRGYDPRAAARVPEAAERAARAPRQSAEPVEPSGRADAVEDRIDIARQEARASRAEPGQREAPLRIAEERPLPKGSRIDIRV
ncbi:MAG: hypothetical protein HXY25_13000 [Alphaproteobacteria bacterium]|nr:hypothetical protein [Alphaproteobacteria bacterium]